MGRTFITGYRQGLRCGRRGPDRAILGQAPGDLRGFVAEGAAMGCAVADCLAPAPRRLAGWLERTDRDFTYLTHVGAGWALARIPLRRDAILRRLDPIHRWLAYDGLGFHDTYFQHRRILAGWRRCRSGYAARAYDQGVGRALWFVGGADVEWAAAAIAGTFEGARRGDLWSGLGLAMGYAGGAHQDAVATSMRLAGPFLADLVQGAIFAAAAHEQAAAAPPHTALTLGVLAGLTPSAAAALAADARARLPGSDRPDRPRYEDWRDGIRAAVAAPAGASAGQRP